MKKLICASAIALMMAGNAMAGSWGKQGPSKSSFGQNEKYNLGLDKAEQAAARPWNKAKRIARKYNAPSWVTDRLNYLRCKAIKHAHDVEEES